ncbi:hypothetical protein ACJIZ3_002214 [Penstemon smallii]|uniref:Uncharacterized protein n=1 Tax=Penstemon smallii TaxID=265156 RepID=A0ABD3U7B1_9LAMI
MKTFKIFLQKEKKKPSRVILMEFLILKQDKIPNHSQRMLEVRDLFIWNREATIKFRSLMNLILDKGHRRRVPNEFSVKSVCHYSQKFQA